MLYNINENKKQTMALCKECPSYINNRCEGINKVCFEYDEKTSTIIDGVTGLPIDPNTLKGDK